MKNFTKGAFMVFFIGSVPPHPLALKAVSGSAALAANSTSCQMWNKSPKSDATGGSSFSK